MGIRAQAVLPGATATEFWDTRRQAGSPAPGADGDVA